MAGLFITVEGTEGVGKSTGIEQIRRRLVERGYEVVCTREPGGTEFGERVRELVLSSEPGSLSAQTEALLMFSARSHHLDTVIRPALRAGRCVLCDRFTDATMAYQGGGRGADPDFLRALRGFVHPGLDPDLTVLLDAPVEVGFDRIRDRELDHFEQEDRLFFERVRAAYLEIARREPERVKLIDASGDVDRVRASLDRVIDAFLSQKDSMREHG